MSAARHTPGPWRGIGPKGDEVIRGPKGRDGYDELICVMGEVDTIANARLIASAPDLLAAAKAVVMAMNADLPRKNAPASIVLAWAQLSAEIDHAEGGKGHA